MVMNAVVSACVSSSMSCSSVMLLRFADASIRAVYSALPLSCSFDSSIALSISSSL